jgi:hypothetical protein
VKPIHFELVARRAGGILAKGQTIPARVAHFRRYLDIEFIDEAKPTPTVAPIRVRLDTWARIWLFSWVPSALVMLLVVRTAETLRAVAPPET